MSVQTETNRIQYTGNGSLITAYPIPFLFFDNAHIIAVETDSAGVETTLALTTNYTLTGVDDPAGGELTSVIAVPITSTLTIYRDVEATQETTYTEQGAFPANQHEEALDKLTMLVQQIQRGLERTFRVSDASVAPDPMPDFDGDEVGVLGYDDDGSVIYTPETLLNFLNLPATVAGDRPLKAWLGSTERALAVPDFVGQVGVETSAGVADALWRGTALSAGSWEMFDLFTLAERTKLSNIETAATADLTGAEITALIDGSIGDAWRIGAEVVHVEDQKTAASKGGVATAVTWNVRDLNTLVTDDTGEASVASNRITLPAGTYECYIKAPARAVNHHRIKLYNYTDSADEILGGNAFAPVAGASFHSTNAIAVGVFTIATAKTFEIRHYTVSSGADARELGYENFDGGVATFTQAIFRRKAGTGSGGLIATALQPADIGVTVQAYDALLDSIATLGFSGNAELVLAVNAAATAFELKAAIGGGDMLASTFDPTTVNGDVFDMDNMIEGTTTLILTDTERAKLLAIEALADVTDATNVAAAGAPLITTSAAAPLGAPTTEGDIHVDTTGDDVYIAAGTAAQADWKQATGAGGGDLLASNDLSDVDSASTSRTNLGLAIGTDVQAWDTLLDSVALLSFAGNGSKQLAVNSGATAFEFVTSTGTGDALTTDPLSQFAATTSAQLAGVLSDETGTGAFVLATSPTLVTPSLGTPSALVGTNISGTASAFTAGAVSTITGLAPDTATTQATQAAITTAANLVTVGALNSGSITSGFGTIDNGASAISTTGIISGIGSGLTGTAASLTAGTVTTNANMSGDVTSSGSNVTTIAAGAVDLAMIATDPADTFDVFVGAALDSPSVSAASNGTTITFTVEKSGTGDVRFWFSDGVYTLDCTPAATVALTPGTDIAPTENFVYLLQSNKTLTVSTSGFPSAEHAPLATIVCQSAASSQTDGLYKFQAWTDHVSGSANSNGHLAHINYWIRQQAATWISGTLCTPSVGAATFDLAISSGSVLQLHPQSFPTFDTSTGSEVMVVNDSTTAYKRVGNLASELTDAAAGSLSGRYYNLVVFGLASESDGDCQIYINLPTGSYNGSADAITDIDATAVYDIPTSARGCAFLISRLTVRHQVSGSTFSISQNTDLRGLQPSTGAGGGGGGGVSELIELTDVDTAADTANFVLATPDGTTGNYSGRALVKGDISGLDIVKTENIILGADGGGSVLTTGLQTAYHQVKWDCTIASVEVVADQSGSVVVDIWKDVYANLPCTDADSITASAPPTLSTAQKSQDATLTGWTTALSAGDYLYFNIDSVTTCTAVTVTLIVTKT
tara:strand:+ start:24231 stop:28196 length:3966 start_codon:yes stop_codon:yes gene_type:complete